MEYSILSVDKFEITGLELSNIINRTDIQFINVKDLYEALNALNESNTYIKAIIWTINSSDSIEFEDIKVLRQNESYKDIPLLIVSKYTGKSYILKAIESGALEYIVKPYDMDSVVTKIGKVLGISLKEKKNILDDDIITFNLSEMLNKEIKAASRGDYPLTLILASVNAENPEFEYKNNSSEVIESIKKVLRTKLRETDTAFIYGNNSVILLLPFTDSEGATTVEEKVKNLFDNHAIVKQKNSGYKLILGSATFPEDGKTRTRLLEKLEEQN